MATGTIKTIRADKGFGFINKDGAPNSGSDSSSIKSAVEDGQFDELREGQAVSFEEVATRAIRPACGPTTCARSLAAPTQHRKNHPDALARGGRGRAVPMATPGSSGAGSRSRHRTRDPAKHATVDVTEMEQPRGNPATV